MGAVRQIVAIRIRPGVYVDRFVVPRTIPPRPSPLIDGVLMLLSEQADDTARPIDDHCKQTGDVTAQHAHVERFQCGDSGIPAPEHDLASLLTSEPNLGFDDNRIGHTPTPPRRA